MSYPDISEYQKIDENGRVTYLREKSICLVTALQEYEKRKDIDTNPMIVQMMVVGLLVPHWYYRSDQIIIQPYTFLRYGISQYIGPPEKALSLLYGRGTYIIDIESMRSCEDYGINEETFAAVQAILDRDRHIWDRLGITVRA